MTRMRRLLPLLAFLALLAAPFGRLGLAEAAAAPHHGAPMAMAGHCDGMPAPAAPGQPDKAAIDCMIACAAIAPATAQLLAEAMPGASVRGPLPLAAFHGIHAGTDPPPPRHS